MRIRVDVPTDELRRERVEHATFAKLDAVRAALAVPVGDPQRIENAVFENVAMIRRLDHSEAVLRPRRRWIPAIAIGAPLAAIGVLAIVLTRGPDSGPAAREPAITQHVVPPHGGPSRWTSAEAMVEAFDDTAVEERIDDGGVTLTLARGKVDCEVEPRAGRAPFRVLAGDITVTVIGTHFAVARTPSGVRVDVSRGKVSVRRGGEEKVLLAGDSWSSQPVITASEEPVVGGPDPKPAPQPPATPTQPAKPAPAKPAPAAVSSKDLFNRAVQIEKSNPTEAARLYKLAAAGRDATYAALALYSLAELEYRRGNNNRAGLDTVERYLRTFPRGANVEDMMWLRIEIYRMWKPIAPMRRSCEEYLQRFPNGTYAKTVRRLLAGLQSTPDDE